MSNGRVEKTVPPAALLSVFAVLDAYEAEANAKAANAERRNKPLMRGYWLAVAIHVRHLRRRIKRAGGSAENIYGGAYWRACAREMVLRPVVRGLRDAEDEPAADGRP